jgi:hypothetical protein
VTRGLRSTRYNVRPTVTIRQAGFPDCIDSEQMFTELVDTLGNSSA